MIRLHLDGKQSGIEWLIKADVKTPMGGQVMADRGLIRILAGLANEEILG